MARRGKRPAHSPWGYRVGLVLIASGTAFVANGLARSLVGGVGVESRAKGKAHEVSEARSVATQSRSPARAPASHEASDPALGSAAVDESLRHREPSVEPQAVTVPDSDVAATFAKDSTSTMVVIDEAYLPEPPALPESPAGESESAARARKAAFAPGSSTAWGHDGRPLARALRLLADDAVRKREPPRPGKSAQSSPEAAGSDGTRSP